MSAKARSRQGGGRSRDGSAEPVIKDLVAAYVSEQPARRRRQAGDALELLAHHLDGYGHESLDGREARQFERLFNAEGAAHREYCETFGPNKIVPELPQFLGWFLIRKVMAGPGDLRLVALETERFVGWLGERGHLPAAVAGPGAALARQAAGALVRAAEVAELLRPDVDKARRTAAGDVIEGYFRVARLTGGKLWLESEETGETYGLAVAVAVAERLAVDWQISGALGRVGRKWVVLEVWNVYPELGA